MPFWADLFLICLICLIWKLSFDCHWFYSKLSIPDQSPFFYPCQQTHCLRRRHEPQFEFTFQLNVSFSWEIETKRQTVWFCISFGECWNMILCNVIWWCYMRIWKPKRIGQRSTLKFISSSLENWSKSCHLAFCIICARHLFYRSIKLESIHFNQLHKKWDIVEKTERKL